MSEAITITINGAEVDIPAEIVAQTRFTKSGAVDKRADNSAFDAWYAAQTLVALPVVDAMPQGDVAKAAQVLADEIDASVLAAAEAQTLVDRIYAGQANDLKPEVRRARILVALQERGLPTDQIDWPDERPEPQKPNDPHRPQDRIQDDAERAVAQAYALKVWAGQEFSLGRAERVLRVRKAIEGQGLSMHGVELPGN
jgi:hypothetical protein